jgi:BirA family biotin operon repressor/biotin-[acetyl-CoA-carboxylase] ligase
MALSLREMTGLPLEIKWPNDLIYLRRKVGGLLLENRGSALVAGVGLNLKIPSPAPARLPGAPPPGSLPWPPEGPAGGPEGLWRSLLIDLPLRYNSWSGMDPTSLEGLILTEAERLLHGLGDTCEILESAPMSLSPTRPPLRGTLEGLDPSGALRLKTPQGVKAVWSGALTFPFAPPPQDP